MHNINYLKHKELIKKLNTFSGTIVLFSYSDTTRDNIEKINNNDILIVDNNENLQGQIVLDNIKIKAPNIIKSLTNYFVVVWGNYCKSNIEQLEELGIKNIFVDLDNGGYRAISKRFIIETPPLSVKKGTKLGAHHKFILNFIKELTLLQIPYKTKPISNIDIDIDKKYKPKKDEVYISYHTRGRRIKNFYRYKESYLPDYVTFDKEGFSGWHSLTSKDISKDLEAIDIKKANNFYEKIYKKYVLRNISKYEQEESIVKLPKKYVFFPLQVATDVVAVLSKFQQEEVLNKLVGLYKDSDIKLVVKKHPKCTDIKLENYLLKLQRSKKIVLYNGSIHKAIKKAKIIYTINSGVGFESLLHLKPVVTFGKCEYGFVTNQILDSLNELKIYDKKSLITKEDIKKYIYFYLKKKAIKINCTKKISKSLLGDICEI